MRFILACLVILLTSCTPYSYECAIPRFALPDNATVEDHFPTRAYFGVSCPSAIPKRFTLLGKDHGTKLVVTLDGEWLRLAAVSTSGSIRLKGPGIRGLATRTRELPNENLRIDAIGAAGTVVDSFELAFKPLGCKCVSYDGV
jgi:hypothetical protein